MSSASVWNSTSSKTVPAKRSKRPQIEGGISSAGGGAGGTSGGATEAAEETQRQQAERRREEKERQRCEAEAAERGRQELANRQHAERIGQLQRVAEQKQAKQAARLRAEEEATPKATPPLPGDGSIIFTGRLGRVVEEVIRSCQPKLCLGLDELWQIIERVFSAQFGHTPTRKQLVAIEAEVIKWRFYANVDFYADLDSDWPELIGNPGSPRASCSDHDSSYRIPEDTAPWQDNAIRALEGD